jgi:Zein-binding
LPETPTHVATEEDMHLLQRRLIFNKNELRSESVDGLSLNSETDSTEPLTIDHLKSALQSEKNALRAIYLELEEERSASAIAANQTMAMINRLQEEKAAMQMEALQYQRMMEEQSEYDQEALQMLNELVVKREKEKEELEKELEAYKHKVLVLERKIGRERDHSLGKKSGSETSSSSSDSLEYSVALENGNDEFVPVEEHLISLESSLDEFEEERRSILEQLKGLEEKLFSLEGSEEEKRSIRESQENENHCQDYESLEDVLHVPENGSINHNLRGKNSGFRGKRLLPLFDAVGLENGEETGEENGDDRTIGEERVSVLEVNEVYERLHALEADGEFIRHCVKSLKKGDAGLDLLNEILQHLRDLRRVELQDTNSGEIASLTA